MADIKKELNDIKNAVYGREVRGSIHDGIKKINEESEESKQKAEEAHEITQDLLDETFDSAALEVNFEQRLNDEIANLQPDWTQFKDDIVQQLAQKADRVDVDRLDEEKASRFELYSKANISDIEAVNRRIDNIITEPAEGISQQEIIDARQGEESLGANLLKIKSEINHKIQNKLKSGFSDWEAHDSTMTDNNDYITVTGNGGSLNVRAEQRIQSGYRQGHKIYLKSQFRLKSSKPWYFGFGLYHTVEQRIISRAMRFPKPDEWHTFDTIVELPSTSHGDSNIAVQVIAGHRSTSDAVNSSFDFKKNVVFLDLTEIFGFGNEPSIEDVRQFLSGLPNDTFSDKTTLTKVVNTNTLGKVNKIDYDTSLDELSIKTVERTNVLPVNRNKYDGNVIPVFNSNVENIDNSVSMYADRENTFEGKPTYSLTSTNGNISRFTNSRSLGNLNNINYLDLYLYVENIDNIQNIDIELYATGGKFTSLDLAKRLKEVKEDGWRVIRIPKSDFVVSNGSPTWSTINYTSVLLISKPNTTATIKVAKIDAVTTKKAAVYLYFDDGLISQYENAFPILEKYGLRGTICVITSRPQLDGYASWNQLRELQNAGWLVVSHGYQSLSLANVSLEEAEYELRKSHEDLRDRGFIFGSKCFVAPQTSWSDAVDKIARKYYAICRTYSYAGAGKSNMRQEFPQSHPRAQYGRSPINTDTVSMWTGFIDEAITHKQEVAISFHDIKENGGTYSNTPQFLDDICQYIRQKIDDGVLECVTWQDTMLQSGNINPIDVEGNQYLVSNNGKPSVLTLPINS